MSVRSIKTATASPSSPTAEPARGREYLSSGSPTPPVWVSDSTRVLNTTIKQKINCTIQGSTIRIA